jgi:hypothetical protein
MAFFGKTRQQLGDSFDERFDPAIARTYKNDQFVL